MRYTALVLSIIGLGGLCLCAPPSAPDGKSIAAHSQGGTNATKPALPAEADPKEEDSDDVFVYQWRGRE
ncbi:hypothetical protein F4801DRAFT_585464 [Xylaria longipes]|nr:hypothetical protein F4801DRAFT_585464 [Xylaria longipes]